ncbi:hypothetical protein [Ideonella sp.]|uniref:hypothetical protein n=1 Tax=Ideonella sp. TaxID=1929293 RepID=UPI0035B4B509
MNPLRLTSVLPATLLLGACLAAHATTYRVTPLADSGSCAAINANGTTVGSSRIGFGEYDRSAWIATPRGKLRTVHGAGADDAWTGNAINASRMVAGTVVYEKTFGFHYAAAWAPDGTKRQLPQLADGASSALGINDAGDVVGEAPGANGLTHPMMWTADRVVDLAPDRWFGYARSVNGRRQAVGVVIDAPHQPSQAALFDNGTVTLLGTLGGRSSEATDINEAGHVVGYSDIADNGWLAHPFIYADGVMRDLGAPRGVRALPSAINNHDVVVGVLVIPNDTWPSRAVIWRHGRMQALNDVLDPVSGTGWQLWDALDINDDGLVCAWGNLGAALLTPMK